MDSKRDVKMDAGANEVEEKNLEELGTDLVEVTHEPHEEAVENGSNRRTEDDLSSKPLTERMLDLMQKISEYGYLTLPEIQLLYANQTHAYKVLNTLKEKELLAEFQTELKPRKAFYLAAKGYRTLEKFGKLRLKRRFLPQHFKPFIFNHRLACAKVGIILQEHPLVRNFLAESLLWERIVDRRQKLCDGEFWFKVPGDQKPERVGLEVELTLKNRDKLNESLRDLHARKDLDQVWWICGNNGILRAVASEVAKRSKILANQHLFCTMESFLAGRHQARLHDHEDTEFSINPANPTLRARKIEPATPPISQPMFDPKPMAPVMRAETAQAKAPMPPQPAPNLLIVFARGSFRCLRGSWNFFKQIFRPDWDYGDSAYYPLVHFFKFACAVGGVIFALHSYINVFQNVTHYFEKSAHGRRHWNDQNLWP